MNFHAWRSDMSGCECTMNYNIYFTFFRLHKRRLKRKILNLRERTPSWLIDLSRIKICHFSLFDCYNSAMQCCCRIWIYATWCRLEEVKANNLFFSLSLQEFLVICDSSMDSLSVHWSCRHVKSLIRSRHIDEASVSASRRRCRICDLSYSSFRRALQLSVDFWAVGRSDVVDSTNRIVALHQV